MNEKIEAFTNLEKEIEGLSVTDLNDQAKKNENYYDSKMERFLSESESNKKELSSNLNQPGEPYSDYDNNHQKPTVTTLSRSSSSSTHTSYQDLPSCLHESFSARLNSRLESFEMLETSEYRTKPTNKENSFLYSPLTSNNLLNLSKDDLELKRGLDKSYLNNLKTTSIPINNESKRSFKENLDESKYRSDYLTREYDPLNSSSLSRKFYPSSTKSAFESDPEVLLMKQKYPNIQSTISPVTQKYLSCHNLNLDKSKQLGLDTKHINKSKNPTFENDYLNIFSLKIKKEGIGSKDLDENQRRTTAADMESMNDTIESTHLDSDYAKSPIFPLDAYGSRPNVHIPKGIYSHDNKIESSPDLDKIYEESKLLDPDCLKLMDRKLKKLIKLNNQDEEKLTRSSPKKDKDFRLNNASVTWEIPVVREKERLASSMKAYTNNESFASSANQSTMSSSYPYLPLRDVPVHELVKKLRHEFELQGDVSNVPVKLNELWMRTQSKTKTGADMEEYFSQKVDYDPEKLKNFVENPASAYVETLNAENLKRHTDNPNNSMNSNIASNKEIKIEIIDKPSQLIKSKEKQQKHPGPSNHDDKNKIQDMILSQKLKHESRIKNLEKLIQLEKLKAEELQRIMVLNQNDSASSYIYDSMMNKSGYGSELVDDDQVDEAFDDSESTIHGGGSPAEAQFNSAQSRHYPHHQESPNQYDSSSNAKQLRYSDEKMKQFISNTNESNTNQIKKEKNAYFFPVENPKFHKERKIEIETISSEPKIYPHPHQPENQKFWEYDRYKSMTLQEAFRVHRYDVILNSRKRVREVKAKEAKRQIAAELRVVDYRMLEKKLDNNRRLHEFNRAHEYERNKRYDYFTALSSRHRNMSQKEMKDQTKKKYQKLPEVQQKILKEKLEENKLKNRIKSNLYKKTIQQRVLSNGPNFNLNFKALGYSIQ